MPGSECLPPCGYAYVPRMFERGTLVVVLPKLATTDVARPAVLMQKRKNGNWDALILGADELVEVEPGQLAKLSALPETPRLKLPPGRLEVDGRRLRAVLGIALAAMLAALLVGLGVEQSGIATDFFEFYLGAVAGGITGAAISDAVRTELERS